MTYDEMITYMNLVLPTLLGDRFNEYYSGYKLTSRDYHRVNHIDFNHDGKFYHYYPYSVVDLFFKRNPDVEYMAIHLDQETPAVLFYKNGEVDTVMGLNAN